jgi:N-acetylmuramoyl-L-alanine amidase
MWRCHLLFLIICFLGFAPAVLLATTTSKRQAIEPLPPLQKIFHQDILKTFTEPEKSFNKTIWGAQVKIRNKKKAPVFVIVIDPGHGGKDSGARGKKGTLEKNVVLSIAKKLQKEINKHVAMRAILTRQADYFVPLRGRLKLARKSNADIFIAIHADAYFNGGATGISVYALSQHGATSEAARWLAQSDNHAELDGVLFDTLQDHSLMLRSVLIDLAQTATIADSIRLGTFLLSTLDDISRLHYRHVEQAPFMVLKSPDIPSILVETGFISNPLEEERLANPQYQQKIAHALWLGIAQYVKPANE